MSAVLKGLSVLKAHYTPDVCKFWGSHFLMRKEKEKKEE